MNTTYAILFVINVRFIITEAYTKNNSLLYEISPTPQSPFLHDYFYHFH